MTGKCRDQEGYLSCVETGRVDLDRVLRVSINMPGEMRTVVYFHGIQTQDVPALAVASFVLLWPEMWKTRRYTAMGALMFPRAILNNLCECVCVVEEGGREYIGIAYAIEPETAITNTR